MMNNNDFKYIIKRVIIGLSITFILFNINKCNASALTLKSRVYLQWYENSHTYNFNGNGSQGYNYWLDPNGIDNTYNNSYLGFILYPQKLTIDNVNCMSYSFSNTISPATPQFPSGQIYSNSITCNSNNTLNNGTISVHGVVVDRNGNVGDCFFSNEYEGVLLCPFPTDNIRRVSIYVDNFGYEVASVYVNISGYGYFFNDDSKEIIEGLGGIQQQQEQTNQIISDNNISGATTETNNALDNIDNSITSSIDSSIDASQLYTILTNFTNQLSNTTCTPISLPFPYTNENIILPCLGTEFSNRIPVIWSIYELIITGAIVLMFWQKGIEFILNVLDPYHIGANNIPLGGGK